MIRHSTEGAAGLGATGRRASGVRVETRPPAGGSQDHVGCSW